MVDTFSRRIVGWSVATTKHAELVLTALEMALWQRDRTGTRPVAGELIHHSDAGSVNTRLSRSPSTWTEPASRPPSARSATHWTTH
ncbi:transposase [Frankia sp. Hr75.2]|nr:transposase [Frankia sp. Hr75.2]